MNKTNLTYKENNELATSVEKKQLAKSRFSSRLALKIYEHATIYLQNSIV